MNGLTAGVWQLQAFIRDNGYTFAPDPVRVNVTLELERSGPASGGLGGGTLLTVFGYGISRLFLEKIRWALLHASDR